MFGVTLLLSAAFRSWLTAFLRIGDAEAALSACFAILATISLSRDVTSRAAARRRAGIVSRNGKCDSRIPEILKLISKTNISEQAGPGLEPASEGQGETAARQLRMGSRAVWAAFEADDAAALESALTAWPNANTVLVNSENPLPCQAARLGRRGVLAAALRAEPWGATAADAELRTPLHHAALAGDLEAVRTVLGLKPERVRPDMLIKQKDAGHMTVLHAAVLSGNEELVMLLLDAGGGVGVDVASKSGLLPVQLACSKGMALAVQTMCGLDNGLAGVQGTGPDGSSLLHRATVEGHAEVVEVLLRCGACDANAQDAVGSTALHLACALGLEEIMEMLVPVTDENLVDHQGKRALDWYTPCLAPVACALEAPPPLKCELVHLSISVTADGKARIKIRSLCAAAEWTRDEQGLEGCFADTVSVPAGHLPFSWLSAAPVPVGHTAFSWTAHQMLR